MQASSLRVCRNKQNNVLYVGRQSPFARIDNDIMVDARFGKGAMVMEGEAAVTCKTVLKRLKQSHLTGYQRRKIILQKGKYSVCNRLQLSGEIMIVIDGRMLIL
ncbi:Uncharacterised protein [Yersinia ruckeri]|uniref:Uncharacterized protein n=1 Tax=Yersinia ruckeri TaxID=29486 RepID=A0A380QNN4_YERRU|nr:hypothetical protein QMA0440_02983 [Yersinia ruckeri]KFE40526.1 DNA polymerase [Yersinia ruckeri]CNH91824.1 Uncharacterised protein [Yersinia ruckeri]SUQ00217.1 Uncharacterised protein [Yersinia ruckeri]